MTCVCGMRVLLVMLWIVDYSTSYPREKDNHMKNEDDYKMMMTQSRE